MHHSLSARPTVSNQYTAFDKSRLTSRENPTDTEYSQAVYLVRGHANFASTTYTRKSSHRIEQSHYSGLYQCEMSCNNK